MRLSECPAKSNNLQLLRFIAALLVIVSHSFSLSTGDNAEEWLFVLTKGQITMDGLAVSVFFCAGGFLIAKSILRAENGIEYFKTRILRIFPTLLAVVLLTAFVLGPLVTTYNIDKYFRNPQVYKYLLNGILIPQHDLPGVFVKNVSVSTVNGSLWTLSIEFLCYIGCYLMWKLKLLTIESAKWSIPFVAVGSLGIYIILKHLHMDVLLEAIRPGLLFYIGVLFYVYRDHVKFTMQRVVSSFLTMLLFGVCGMLDIGLLLCFPYLLLYICFAIVQIPGKIGVIGNISYGMYLCAFPIQQLLVFCHAGSMSPYVNMLLSIPMIIICGYILYKLVEQPTIRWERKKTWSKSPCGVE